MDLNDCSFDERLFALDKTPDEGGAWEPDELCNPRTTPFATREFALALATALQRGGPIPDLDTLRRSRRLTVDETRRALQYLCDGGWIRRVR